MCADEIQRGQLVPLLPGWAPHPGVFHAVFPSRRGMVPAVRRFLDFMEEHHRTDGLLA
jgi:DNA-binding transcriptional LysR family regulator